MSAPRRLLLAVLALSGLSACATYQAYEGPKRPASEVAVINGDAKLRADTPLALVIRAIDGATLDVRYSSAAVLPGKHTLLIDCQLGGTAGTASRHEVSSDFEAGRSYRLEA